jgi:isoquinoline 1-oxidoreductase alpha subunit
MSVFSLHINGNKQEVEVSHGTPLLWVLREHLGLTGTKYGCGIGQCGSCTVHVDGLPMKACTIAVENVSQGQKIKTIEGLSEKGDHPLQLAWIEAQAPQCGYCQSGQIMQAASLLEANPHPTRQEIMSHMNGNICRCGTYLRIIKAVKIASGGEMSQEL